MANPVPIGERAADDLRAIRAAMDRSRTFTAVPGRGGAAMGGVGLAAAAGGALAGSPEAWLAVWLAAAAVALGVGLTAMHAKAARAGVSMAGPAARQFALGLAAPFVAGGALTAGLWQIGAWSLMAPTWLLLYGAGVLAGGAFSVPAVRAMGAAFMALGLAALVTPAALGNLWLGAGFGALQVGFGFYIARHHGG
ncbi:MAG: hypothetical protein AB1635_19715 [Acidobacteriota bacterium]